MALELAAVIGEHRFDGEGEHGLDEAKELRGGGAGVAAGGPGPSEMRMQIGAGNHVAALIGGPQLDAVQRHAMARMEGVKMLRLAQPWSAQGRAFAMGANALWAGAHFVRRLRDQPANGAGTRARQMAHRGEGQQQQMQLFFGEIGMERTQAADLRHQCRGPLATAAMFRGGRPRHQRRHVATFGGELGTPQIKRSPADRERFVRSG